MLDETDFIHMAPADSIIKNIFKERSARVLAREGPISDLPMRGGTENSVLRDFPELPEGNYTGEWIDTKTGVRTKVNIPKHPR